MTKTPFLTYRRLVVPAKFKVADGQEVLMSMRILQGCVWNAQDQQLLSSTNGFVNPSSKLKVIGFRPTWRLP